MCVAFVFVSYGLRLGVSDKQITNPAHFHAILFFQTPLPPRIETPHFYIESSDLWCYLST